MYESSVSLNQSGSFGFLIFVIVKKSNCGKCSLLIYFYLLIEFGQDICYMFVMSLFYEKMQIYKIKRKKEDFK